MADYIPTYSDVLIDSGAFSEFSSKIKIDIHSYSDWALQWESRVSAIAGLDSIQGDWRQSLKNYAQFEQGFPTYHDSDPPELLRDLIEMAKERNQWIGIGLVPPRTGKEKWMKSTLEQIPEGIHVHGWACRAYTKFARIDSVDSTNWWRDSLGLKSDSKLKHLTHAECLEIIVKRYKRWERKIENDKSEIATELFKTI